MNIQGIPGPAGPRPVDDRRQKDGRVETQGEFVVRRNGASSSEHAIAYRPTESLSAVSRHLDKVREEPSTRVEVVARLRALLVSGAIDAPGALERAAAALLGSEV